LNQLLGDGGLRNQLFRRRLIVLVNEIKALGLNVDYGSENKVDKSFEEEVDDSS